jgi:hypothetical protein
MPFPLPAIGSNEEDKDWVDLTLLGSLFFFVLGC